jgi:hypothetical protein
MIEVRENNFFRPDLTRANFSPARLHRFVIVRTNLPKARLLVQRERSL